MGYAEKIRRLCALKGLDQAHLASETGLSRSTMSRILTGRQEPKLGVARAIASALGVTIDYLLDEVVEPSQHVRWEAISEEEAAILRLARRLGTASAIDRLLSKSSGEDDAGDPRPPTPQKPSRT